MKRTGNLLALLLGLLAALFVLQPAQGGQSWHPARQFQPGDRLVAKEASLALLVLDTRKALQILEELRLRYAGEILSSQEWTVTDHEHTFLQAAWTVRIPAADFEAFLLAARGLSMAVLSESASGTDLTDQYVELTSLYRSLEIERWDLTNLFQQSRTDIEKRRVQEELLDTEEKISGVYTQLQAIEEKTFFARLSIELNPFIPTPTPTMTATPLPTLTPTPWDPAQVYAQAQQTRRELLAGQGAPWLVLAMCCCLPLIFVPWGVRSIWKKHRKSELHPPG